MSRWNCYIASKNRGYRPAGTRNALPGTGKNLDAKAKRETNVIHVRGIHLDLASKLPLAPGRLRAEQMTLAGMPAHDFSGGRHLKALGRAAVRLQLHFLVLLHNFLVWKKSSGLAARRLRWPCRSRGGCALFRSQQREQDVRLHARPELHLGVIRNFPE